MPPQIKRLALLFVIFIGLFITVRHFLVPKSFGEYGHYRGLSLTDNQSKAPMYAGEKLCAECHDDMTSLKSAHEHATLSCETCHGPGLAHANSTDSLIELPKPRGRDFCGICHSINVARTNENVVQVDLIKHNPAQNCTECHNPHDPWEKMR